MTERNDRVRLPIPTREQLAGLHHSNRSRPETQRLVQKINQESHYVLMVSRTAYQRRDRSTPVHATRTMTTAICGKSPIDPLTIAPDGTRAVTCQGCLSQMDRDYSNLSKRLGYKGKGTR